MSLRIWLPMTKDLRNQGLDDVTVTNNGATFNSAGKLGGCYKTSSTATIDLGYNGNQVNTGSISFGGWFNFNKAEIWSAISGKSYNTNANAATGCLIGNNSYGGVSLQWYTNNIYTSNSLTALYVQGYLRSSTNGARATSGFSLPFDTWVHIYFTFDKVSNIMTLYINGENKYTYTNVAFSDARNYNLFVNLASIAGGNGPAASIPFLVNDVRIYDHCLSPMEIKELSKGLVLHYPLSDRFLESTTNLVTSITSGGQTTWTNNILTTSGTNADTYFTINLSESIVNGTQYTISCDAEDIPQGTCWTFPLGQQGNTALSFQIYNGHNEYTFTANNISWGTNRCFMDDGGSPNSARATGAQCKIYNFQIEKKDHATGFAGYGGTRNSNMVYDCSGFCNNSILNISTTISTDTAKYTHSTYFGEYNTPKTDLIDNSLLPALTNCTITWWEKNDTTRTLLLTGQTTSYFIAASNSNTYYHGEVNGTKTLYRDGVAGTYSCEAGKWHHYALVGVDISSWTALHLNSYSSYWTIKGLVSDFRIYATALSADDVKSLYQNSAYIDSSGNVYGAVHSEV